MPASVRVFAKRAGRFFNQWIGWKRLGIVASLVIVTIALLHLVRTLKGVDSGIVLTALTEKSEGQIALAALCVICAFGTLTFYDLFALRTIGKIDVPYRIAALSSFTSYTIGHNIGATVFTGGAIRFRIYSDWGLTAIDVAKICFISGLTFWLGNTLVLGMGLVWHPQAATAIDLMPEAINRLIGFGGIAGITAYLAWLAMGRGRRELGQNGWRVKLPSARLTLLQIAIGVVDLGFCALAMYLLAPNNPQLDFMTLAVVFILATLLGFASHAPGSLGVFDAAMLVGLPMLEREELIASLLLFRILYFVIPLRDIDYHHGNARVVAQRRAALATAPPEKRPDAGPRAGPGSAPGVAKNPRMTRRRSSPAGGGPVSSSPLRFKSPVRKTA